MRKIPPSDGGGDGATSADKRARSRRAAQLFHQIADEHRQQADELGVDDAEFTALREQLQADPQLAQEMLSRHRRRVAEELRRRAVEVGGDEGVALALAGITEADAESDQRGLPISSADRAERRARWQFCEAVALACELAAVLEEDMRANPEIVRRLFNEFLRRSGRRQVEVGGDEDFMQAFLRRLAEANADPAYRQKPDWSRWLHIPRLPLWKAIALSCDLEPQAENVAARPSDKSLPALTLSDHLSRGSSLFDKRTEREAWEHEQVGKAKVLEMFPEVAEFRRRLEIAEENVEVSFPAEKPPGRELVRPGELVVTMAKFSKWIEARGWTLPDAFPRRKLTALAAIPSSRHPGGAYSSKLLEHLEAAMRQFWSDFDPADPRRRHKRDTVERWLHNERGLESKHACEAIALIIHPDSLRHPTSEPNK
jgi:hypothetical protein